MHKFENIKFNHHTNGSCCWDGCADEGRFPAPKSPENWKEKYYFCLQHIREYNNSWDFFNKMDRGQIDSFQKENIVGHRPTWKFGVGNASYHNIEEIKKQVFTKFRGGYTPYYKTEQERDAYLCLPKQTRDSLKVLGLGYPVTLKEIKKRYKELAKAHHPDLNGRADDDKIKNINHAYNVLKGIVRD